VQGTPTFFLNGRQLTDLRTQDDLVAAIDAALAE
jgi:protein-disulfide isomerase